MDILLFIGLTILSIINSGLTQKHQRDCQDRNLNYGQSYYLVNDPTNRKPLRALRGSQTEYKGELKRNVTFSISVPDAFKGVKIHKLCMFTRNVILVQLRIHGEQKFESLPNGGHAVLGGDVLGLEGKFEQLNRYNKICFRPPGEVARIQINFIKGSKIRIRLQKLHIEACQGED